MNLVEITQKAIQDAEQNISKITTPVLDLVGFSSPKVRHFLNNVVNSNSRYLEIGIWAGSTFVPAMYKNDPEIAFAIDWWCECITVDDDHRDHPRNIFLKAINDLIETKNIVVINDDCFKINPADHGITNINTYFYDGNHLPESHYNALKYYYESLTDKFIFIVDDWLMGGARDGTRDAIRDLNLKILFEEELPADFNGDTEKWWDGLYVSVLEK